MTSMPTRLLKLRKCPDGYYRTSWWDDNGTHRQKSFGRNKARAQTKFGRFYAEWQNDDGVRNACEVRPVTINEAWARFKPWAVEYYRRADGSATGQAANIGYAMRPVLDMFGDLRADQFGPKRLEAVQAAMVDAGCCVNVINERVRKIRQVWKWLVAQELVPAGVWHGLQAVASVRPGRTAARVTEPVGPVPEEHVWQVVEHVPGVVGAMIQVQFWTGARPGEVCIMRPVDLDMTGSVWIYSPPQHKTSYRQKRRTVMLGPRAQDVVRPLLAGKGTSAYLFSPRDAETERNAACATHRHQPVEKPATTRRVQRRYTPTAYARCIRRICDEHAIPRWSPNQLRHNAATRLRKAFGLDVAQVVLGHAKADVTEVYAELDMGKAVEAMERAG